MNHIEWNDFQKVELRVGTIIEVEDFPEARKPAFILKVDFGNKIGIKKSSAQITDFYNKESLLGMQIIAVVNFAPKQICPIMSECLITGFPADDGNDGGIVLAVPDKKIPNGARLV